MCSGPERVARATVTGRLADTAVNNHAAFIWSVADLLRGDYKQSEYGRVILPPTVLRRFNRLTDITGLWNTSKYELVTLLDDAAHLADNLRNYVAGFTVPGAA